MCIINGVQASVNSLFISYLGSGRTKDNIYAHANKTFPHDNIFRSDITNW